MLRIASSVILAAVMIAAPAHARTDNGYRTVQSVSVADGSLQVLEDARLTPALARRLWRVGVDPVFALGEDNPAAKAFMIRPLRPARLREVDASGEVFHELVLNTGAPVARIEKRRLGLVSDPVYLITTDDDAGFGSYSGRPTTLYSTQGKQFQPVRATGTNGEIETVVLVNTLKSGWKITDSNPEHIVIHQLLCRLDLGHEKSNQDEPFLLSYITYQSDGHAWRMAKRVTSGFWESDQGWPASSMFPTVGAH